MTQPLSHNFITALQDSRDLAYTRALASAGTPHAAEQLLLQKSRDLFSQYAKSNDSHASPLRLADDLLTSLSSAPAPTQSSALSPQSSSLTPMPADLWARIAAAIQLEAARSANAKALNPDSVLLRPDPLLAPKKIHHKREPDNFDLTSPSRLIVAAIIILLLALIATVYLFTRPGTPPPPQQNSETTTAQESTPHHQSP